MPPARRKPTLTVPQAADMLGLPRRTLYDWCRKGAFPHIRLGRRVLVSRETVEALLAPGVVAPHVLRRLGSELPW